MDLHGIPERPTGVANDAMLVALTKAIAFAKDRWKRMNEYAICWKDSFGETISALDRRIYVGSSCGRDKHWRLD